MIGKKVWTLAITTHKIVVARVDIKRKKINKSEVYDHSDIDLLDKLSEVIKDLKITNVKILLSDDLCNFWGILVPEDLKENEKYEFIKSEILKEYSGDPDSLIWDFVDAGEVGVKRKVVAFSTKQSILKVLTKFVRKNEIVIETVEPESFSRSRHDNPIIGISLKNDLQSNLAQIVEAEPIEIIEIKQFEELPSKNKDRLVMIAKLASTILLALAVVSIFYTYSQKSSGDELDEVDQEVEDVDPEIVVDPSTASGLVIVEPSLSPTLLSGISLSILNGSGVDGEAAYVSGLMRSEGFRDIQTGNADTQDNEITIVSYRSEVPKIVLDAIEEYLEEYDLEFVEAEDEADQAFDIQIIVGVRS